MGAFIYPIYTLASVGLVLWEISLFQQEQKISTILLIVVLAGMTYDNLIISIGCIINEGDLLKTLNRLRFTLHNLFVPLLVVTAVQISHNAGVVWMKNSLVHYGGWAIAFSLIILGLVSEFRSQELTPTYSAGTLRYKPQSSEIPILTILTAILVAVAGIYIWYEIQWPWMLVGTLVMLFGNALSARFFSSIVSSFVDFLFILALLATDLIVL
ncbi:MAG: hypothetical protein KME21_28290 [Desmonostoc vinosum HA7617-LM4]|jgi:hypothetical protein|nr:hypothetical protein [Desmonostoc vinosum HA7617-LM4]